jgi:hypothetical protein
MYERSLESCCHSYVRKNKKFCYQTYQSSEMRYFELPLPLKRTNLFSALYKSIQ